MNQRIRELTEQAKQYAFDAMIKIADKEQALKVYSETYDVTFAVKVYSETYDVTFAELIVRGCYEWAKENGGLSSEYDYDALKEHFGVES